VISDHVSDVAALRRARWSSEIGPRRLAKAAESRLPVTLAAVAIAMLPLLVPGGPANTAPVDLLMGLTIAAAVLWTGTSLQRWRFPYVAGVALLLGGGAIGALRGPVPGTGAIALVQDVILLFWCWALVNISSSPERLRPLVRTWAYSSIAWVLLLFGGLATGMTALTGQRASEGVRTSLTLVDANLAGNYYFISIMVIWATQCPRRRSVRLLAYALLLAAIFTTGSSGALTSVAIGGAVAALLGLQRRAGLVPMVAATALGAVAFMMVHSAVSVSSIEQAAAGSKWAFVRDGLGRGEQSAQFRDVLLQESTRLYEQSGALGAGPVSTKVRLASEQAPVVKEAHDDYLAALLERGVLGFAGLILLLATLVVRGLSFTTGRLSRGYEQVIVRPNALVGALAGTFVAAAVYEVLHVRHVWALFAFVAALSIWGRE
jgi:hypothetical protein